MDAFPLDESALRQSAGLLDASGREAVRLVGPERASFLHGMVTQDVEGLAPGRWAYAAACTAKGAMVADCRVLVRAEELWLDTEPGYGERLLGHLSRFLISEDAELHGASDERAVLVLVGPAAPQVAGAAGLPVPEGNAVADGPDGTWLLQHALYGVPAVEVFVPVAGKEALKAKLAAAGATLLPLAALETLRVEAGVGRMGADMDEVTIPLEANLERGIHYQKGCYLGQEVIARVTFRGQVNKKLSGLRFTGALPARGTELRKGEKVVGRVTSAVQSPGFGAIGLGYVHRLFLEPGTELELPDGSRATVGSLPFR
ncbi:MAG: folate-binding protein YgfZ [Deltaproteobacteria bacterium]|nr:folate-binding protein YgfZ [Deltaproteobacteria bacterium]